MTSLIPQLYCPDCEVWWRSREPCEFCGHPGVRTTPGKYAQRWTNPVQWKPEETT